MANSQKILNKIAILITFLFIISLITLKFHWYYTIWWFDMPMHFLGGVFLGLSVLFVISKYLPRLIVYSTSGLSLNTVILVFMLVLMIGLFWEIFELLNDHFFQLNQQNTLDTVSDLFFDMSGGLAAVVYFFKK